MSKDRFLSLLAAAALVFGGCSSSERRGGSGSGDGEEGEGEGEGSPAGPCDPGAVRCSGSTAEICNADGNRWERGEVCGLSGKACKPGVGCVDQGDIGEGEGEGEGPSEGEGEGPAEGEGEGPGEGEGEGAAEVCAYGARECRGSELWFCLGTEWGMEKDCNDTDQTCEVSECIGCEPGERACIGRTVVECDALGRRLANVEVCPPGTQCSNGGCVRICGEGGDDKVSYQGCEYWAVDLDNADVEIEGSPVSPATAQFAVVVSNVNASPTTVTVYSSDDGVGEDQVAQQEIEPGDIEVINLPPRSQNRSGKAFLAYRVAASQPVIAYQFNPLNNTDEAFSNDASLLIPSNAYGRDYIVVTGDGIMNYRQGDDIFNPYEEMPWASFLVVVGVGEDPVEVTVEASTDVQPPEGRGVELVGRRTVRATLARYEVLSVHSAPPPGDFSNPFAPVPPPHEPGQSNLSGSRVRASGPVAVFAGNTAVSIPLEPQVCCADHLEEQMWPVSVWGRSFVAARSLVRRSAEPETDLWRLTGSENGTVVQYQPRVPRGAPESLDEGESVEFEEAGHFLVHASAPVLLAQFLTSSEWVAPEGVAGAMCQAEGERGDAQCTRDLGYLAACVPGGLLGHMCRSISDPAMVLVPPVEQYRRDYAFLAPLDYQIDFVNLIAPEGTVVRLDGAAVPQGQWRPVGQLGGVAWSVATLEVPDGRHEVEAEAELGVLVYGYDRDVSYGYPGGLNLEALNPDPVP